MLLLDQLTANDFIPHIDTPFTIRVNDDLVVPLVLTSVNERSDAFAVPGVGRLPFSLEFHGRHRGHLHQQIWRLEHETLGTLDLFLVPLGPDANGMRYEAVFN